MRLIIKHSLRLARLRKTATRWAVMSGRQCAHGDGRQKNKAVTRVFGYNPELQFICKVASFQRKSIMLRIYNTLTRQKEEFKPIEPGKVGMYVCGVTIYDYCHIGHGRTFVCFDVIVRYLRYLGYKVT